MSNKKDLGVYLKSTKTFYYLEYGENYVNNTLDRVRKTLLQRNLIIGIPDNNSRNTQYEVISYGAAVDSGLDMQPIYISKHIEALLKAKSQTRTSGAFK